MVDIVDFMVSKVLNLLLGVGKTIKMCIEEIYKYIKIKVYEKKKINSKYFKCRTKIFTEHQYKKIKKKKNVENIGSNVHITLYKEKSNNNNKRKIMAFTKLKNNRRE